MIINYDLGNKTRSYDPSKKDDVKKINFLLTNPRGDFLNMGVIANTCKFQGFNVLKQETSQVFKFIDEIIPSGLEVGAVVHSPTRVSRDFYLYKTDEIKVPVAEEIKADHKFEDEGQLNYDGNGVLNETTKTEIELKPNDSFFLSPSGGMIYEINDFYGELFVDIDMKLRDDFDEFGRNYKTYEDNGVIFVEYQKEGTNEVLFLGIDSENVNAEKVDRWIKKDYEYSKRRGSMSQRYVYRPYSINVRRGQQLIIGAGFSKEDVHIQIDTLKSKHNEIEDLAKDMNSHALEEDHFHKPITEDIDSAYRLSKIAMYNFLNMDMKGHPNACYAGFPWFSDIWTRDDVVSFRAFINMNDEPLVRDKIHSMLENIDEESGGIPILLTKDSNNSCDSVLFLAKRIEDFISKLEVEGRIGKVFTSEEISFMYRKLYAAFKAMTKTNWDFDNELIKVRFADSWMDTVHRDHPVEMQVLYLEFVSFMAVLANMTGHKDDASIFLDLEDGLRKKIHEDYFKDGNLYEEPGNKIITSNVFLSYYLYPDLFTNEQWEAIFDNSLKVLKTPWGGIGSLDKNDVNFREYYSGEDNLSYHQGDSWFWINNIAAIVLHDLNEKKYRSIINGIVSSSTEDILKMGTLGYASEVSSFKEQKAEGTQAQLWSNSTYIEMIDKLFEKE